MNILPEDGGRREWHDGRGEFTAGAAFDAAHVYDTLQQACRALEANEEHAAAAYVAQAMAMVHDRYRVGHDDRDDH